MQSCVIWENVIQIRRRRITNLLHAYIFPLFDVFQFPTEFQYFFLYGWQIFLVICMGFLNFCVFINDPMVRPPKEE